MTSFDQVPFDASEFVDNPEPRCPCLLLLDASTSMAGQRIDELNAGLDTFASQLTSDGLASTSLSSVSSCTASRASRTIGRGSFLSQTVSRLTIGGTLPRVSVRARRPRHSFFSLSALRMLIWTCSRKSPRVNRCGFGDWSSVAYSPGCRTP
jgi:hypothetical protein